jgi:hypothetical protein
MRGSSRWPRVLVIVGVAAMVVGAIDPLEGSLVILPGIALVVVGARLLGSRFAALLTWALGLIVAGIGALWGLSAVGGFGGPAGLSPWWGLLLVPYPVGWILGLVLAIRTFWENEGVAVSGS